MRHLWLLGTLVTSALLSATYILQYGFDLQPCSLCILQRLVLWIIAIVFLIAFGHHPRRLGSQIYGLSLFFLNACGSFVAIRQLWLQFIITDHATSCSADIKTLLQLKPWMEVLSDLLIRDKDCSLIDRFLGIPLSVWSLSGFLALGTLSLFILMNIKHLQKV